MPVTVSEQQLKEAAIHALEYSINGILLQVQLKYNVRITGIRLAEDGDLRGVRIEWQETASGILTDEDVQQRINEMRNAQLLSITEKLGGNG